METFDVAVIGCGVAGVTAAISAAREMMTTFRQEYRVVQYWTGAPANTIGRASRAKTSRT